jgi:chromosome partitioning protein
MAPIRFYGSPQIFEYVNQSLIAKPYHRQVAKSYHRNIAKAGAGMIIGVLNQKGGVGKTTIAINLAENGRVLLVDADPQASAMAWSSARQREPLCPVIGMAKPTLHRDLPTVAADYDTVVIDGAPRVNDLGRAAIMASDIVLIPVQPSPLDFWATSDIAGLIAEAQQFKPALKAVIVMNRKIVNTAIGRDVAAAMAGYGFQVLPVMVHQRVAFAEAMAQGLAVLETAPGSDATLEIRRLAAALAPTAHREAA